MRRFLVSALLVCVTLLRGAETQTFTNSASIVESYPTMSLYPSTISVTGMTGAVTKVTATIYNFSSEMDYSAGVLLMAPSGEKLVLMIGAGYTGPTVGQATLTFDDDAASEFPLDFTTPLASGTFKPGAANWCNGFPDVCASGTCPYPHELGSHTLAGTFTGVAPNGNWKLYVSNSDPGSINIRIDSGWSLTLTTEVTDAATATSVSSGSGGASPTGDAVTFTATVTSGGSPVTSGSVTFKEGSTTLGGPTALNGSGQAAFTTSALAEGRHTLTAEYGGATGYLTSSGTVTQSVDDTTTVSGMRFCNPGTDALPALGTAAAYPLRVSVSGISPPIGAVTVSLDGLTYPAPNALQAMLVGPAGTAAKGLDFFSHAANASAVTGVDLVFTDTAAGTVPSGSLVSGTYQPTSTSSANTWAAPAPSGPYQFAATAGTYTLSNVFNGGSANGWWSLYLASTGGGSTGSVGEFCIEFGVPDVTIDKSHTGDFRQGQTGALYTIRVSNGGTGATSGLVTVTDTLPTGLTATALSGTGWTCVLGTLTCTRSDALAASASYPDISLTVSVATDASASLTNSVSVSGGGDSGGGSDTDPTTVNPTPDLTVTKTHSGDFSQGQTGAAYTVTVTNSGTGATSGTVTLYETPSSGLTATAITGTGWDCVLGTLTCTRSDALPAGNSYPAMTVTVDVAGNASSSVTNSVTVAGGGELNTSNDVANDATTVTPKPDLTIAKSHTGSFTQGQTGAAYTITVTNSGSAATSGTVSVTDTLPSALTATGITGTGWSCTLGTLTCTRSDALASTNSYPAITVTADVAANAAASITNTATVSGGGELNTANDSASDPTTVVQVADLTIAKSHTGNFTQGQTGAAYTLTVTNSGPGPTTGTVTVVDALPSGLTATGLSGTGWSCTLGTLTCTRSDALAAGSSYPVLTVTLTVASDASASLTNTATVAGGGELNTTNNSASDATTVIQVADLTIAKSHSGNFAQGQTGATYTLTVSNSGPGPTSGTVTVADTLPTGLSATGIAGTGWSCTLGTLTCTRSDALASGSSYPAITVTVTVASNAGSSLTNTATVSGGGELNTSNDSASDATTVVQVADLTITKSHSGNFTQGQTGATYTLTVSNSGPGPTTGTVTVADTLPTGLTATGMAGTGWSCTLGTLTCTRSDALASSSSYPAITVTADVAATAAASLTNTASVSGGGEINTSNDAASDATTVVQLADLTITKSHTGNFTQGETGAAYTITVTNSGLGPTSGTVTVADTLPAGLTATAIAGTGWSCTLSTLTCTRSDVLASSNSYPALTVTVDVAANTAASISNTAAVAGGGQIITSNDTATDSTTVIQLADLTIAKSHTGSFRQGQTGATYGLTVSNSGPGPTSGTVTLSDTLPSGLAATAISGTGWTCALDTLTCTSSDALASGHSYPAVTLTVTVAGNASATLVNTAAVSGGGELNTTNNSASDSTTIVPVADLTIAASHTGSFAQGQTNRAYTIVIGNAGPGATAGAVTVADTLPASLTATSMAGSGWSCTLATLSCTRSDVLAAGANYPAITLTVSVAADAPNSVTNAATVSGGGELNLANDTAEDATTVLPTTAVTIAASPEDASFVVDGASYSSAQTLSWVVGSEHTLAVAAEQAAGDGVKYVFLNWSDGGTLSHTVTTPAAPVSYTANLQTQYRLVTASGPGGGSVEPEPGGFYPAGWAVQLQAIAARGYGFRSWTGPVANPGSPSTSVIMTGPVLVIANFEASLRSQTIRFDAIADKTVDDAPFALQAWADSGLPVSFSLVSGPATISGNSLRVLGPGTVVVRASQEGDTVWAPAVPVERSFRVVDVYTLLLAVTPQGGGAASAMPSAALSRYPAGTVVQVGAQAAPGFVFAGFQGDLGGTASPQSLEMSRNRSVIAVFVPISDLPQDTFSFGYQGSGPLPQPLRISVTGAPFPSVTLLPETGGNWLRATDAPQPNPSGIELSLDAAVVANLSGGTYTARVALNSGGAWRLITVTLYVDTAGISGAVESAGYQQVAAAEAMLTLFGFNLALEPEWGDPYSPPLSLGGAVASIIDAAGTSRPATFLYVSPGQLNLVLPAGLAAGPATLTLTTWKGETTTRRLEILSIAPGLFTSDSTGTGYAAAGVLRFGADASTWNGAAAHRDNSGRWVADPIDVSQQTDRVYLSLYGTGIRGRTGLEQVSATVDGVPALVLYAGPQLQYAGLDQVNLLLPSSLAGRGEADVVLSVDGRSANTVRIVLR